MTAHMVKKQSHQPLHVNGRPRAMYRAGRYVVLASLCALCYSNSVHGELVHDDVWAIVNNPDVRADSSLRKIFSDDFWGKPMSDNTSHKSYRPLCILTFKLNVLLHGMNPFYFHVTNLLLHCAVTCLLMYTCECCVFEDGLLAFVTALIFAVHPIHTEAVTGVVGRADVLACMLFLLAFLSYISHMLGSRFSDFLHISSPFTKRACFISVCDNPASFSPYLLTRILTYSYLLSFNAWLLLVPVVLCYDWQVGSIPLVESLGDLRNGATVLLALVIITLCIRCLFSLKCAMFGALLQGPNGQESREILVGVLFLVFPFIPASNLFFRVGFVVAERVLYMPSMGYCILVALGVSRLCTVVGRYGTTVVSVSVVLLLLSFSWKTVHQNQVWLSREALFRSGIRTLPHNAKVHYNYANFLKDSGQLQEAIQHYSTALRLYPQHASAMNNLGTLTQSPEEAESYYRKALVINPQHNRALFNLGNLFKSQGKEKEAESLLRNSIHFGPYFADAYSSLASLYAEQKRFAEAKEIYLKGIGRCPENSDLHNNYGVFLVDTGEDEMAVDHYQQAIRLKPTHYIAMVNLGRLLRLNNKNQDAEFWYKRALQVTKNVDILTPLGALYYNTGRYEEALQVYREATTLQPDNTDIWLAFAQVLAVADHTNEAEKLTLEIISKEISCIECYRLLSAIYSKRGNYTEALGALDRALQQNLGDLTVRAELYFSKGNQLRELNLLDQAFKSYKLAVELKPDQSQAWMNMGGIQHIKGDYAAARMYYQRALLLNPSSKLLKENLAKLDRLERRLSAGEK
ncbi:protein O-mannosyl-transferase TMTC1 isoform X5 [Takifugu flavidus]|uniref:protein O-mannosyl-transferase TMTC1 isoform X5 n=1 Tax=Takifugu flavidus TaxID=433684 RepID=UPI00254401EB|nr:protein O-mannosyl-transferase TMTC1 isoform X5 [Takifugu flavidus]